MRRFFLFLSLCVALLWFAKTDLETYNAEIGGVYKVYTQEKTDAEAFVIGDITVFSADVMGKLSSDKVLGETIVTSGDKETVNAICERLGVIFRRTETVDDIYIVYGYSFRLKRTRIINNAPVNIQITLRNGVITVSNPINQGSF